jgi:hypothetical protein
MRNISDMGLAKLTTKLGNEPIIIIEIDWVDGGTQAYADRMVASIPGKIVEVGDLDDAMSLAGNSSSSQLSVKLDDTDGTIKAILDTHDPHKRPARVYQYFHGLALSDRFLLFSGVLMTPISWNERDRTVTVTIVSQLEDQECGYTTDEYFGGVVPGTVPNQAWPLIFGRVKDNKAGQLQPPLTGTTLTPVGVLAGAELMLNSPDDPGVIFLLSVQKTSSQLDFLDTMIQKYDSAAAAAANNATAEISDTLAAAYAPMSGVAISQMFAQAAVSYAASRDGYIKQRDEINRQTALAVIDYEARKQCTINQRKVKLAGPATGLRNQPGQDPRWRELSARRRHCQYQRRQLHGSDGRQRTRRGQPKRRLLGEGGPGYPQQRNEWSHSGS